MATETAIGVNSQRCIYDEWPKLPDGVDWDGTNLLDLVKLGQNPFGDALDVQALVREIESSINIEIADIPIVSHGANHFGFHVKTSTGRLIVARLSRGDMNRGCFDAEAMNQQVMHDHFELAVYEALESLGGVFGCGPLYHRDPVRCDDGNLLTPNKGRRLFLFEKVEGDMYHYGCWRALDEKQKICLLIRSASVSAALFRFQLPEKFCSD